MSCLAQSKQSVLSPSILGLGLKVLLLQFSQIANITPHFPAAKILQFHFCHQGVLACPKVLQRYCQQTDEVLILFLADTSQGAHQSGYP
jgi:hypothetical protein